MKRMSQAIRHWVTQRRWVRRLLWAVGSLLALWLLAWLVVPPLARTQIERQASEALGRKVTVEQVEFWPWSLEATVRGLSIASQDGKDWQFKLDRIYVNAELQSLFRLAPVVDALEIDGPQLRMAQTAPGRFDFDDVLAHLARKPQAPKDEGQALPRFAVYNITIREGALTLDDRTMGQVHHLRHLQLDVPFLSNLAADRQVKVKPRLAFDLDGSGFDTVAQAMPFDDSHRAQARLQVRRFDLAPYAAYVAAHAPVQLRSGVLNADLEFEFAQQPRPQLNIRGGVRLEGVQIADAAAAPLLGFERLQVSLKDVRPLDRVVELESVTLHAPHAWLRRDASGVLQVPGQGGGREAAVQPAAPAAAAPAKEQAPWQIRLAHLQSVDGRVDWQDDSLPGGTVQWTADQLQLQASDMAWPMTAPLRFRASTQVGGAGVEHAAARLAAEGQVTAQQARVALSVRALPLALAGPYLAGVLKPAVSGMLDADIGLARDGQAMVAEVASLALDRLSLDCPAKTSCRGLRSVGMADAAATSLLALGHLELADSTVWLHQRRASLGRVALRDPKVLVERSRQGRFMFEDWLPPAGTAAQQSGDDGKPWALRLEQLQIDGARLAWRDAVVEQPVALDLVALQASVRGVEWQDGRMPAAAFTLDTRMAAGRAEPGRLRLDGTLALAPEPQIKTRISAQRLPLHALAPYVADQLNADIVRADGSFDGMLRFQAQQDGPKVVIAGDAALDDVRVLAGARQAAGQAEPGAQARRVGERGEQLLGGKRLQLRAVDLQVEPGRPLTLQVQETALSDFFARIIVQEDGRLNLQDIRKTAPVPDAGTTAAAPAQAAGRQSAPQDGLAPVLHFGPVTLTNGAVRFTDHFIKPNYSADLSELSGRLGAFTSEVSADGAPQMAELTLKGKAQTTAALEVSGRLNPLAQPLALDIQAKMRDLELPPLSPYSVKYAGHGIERGKLSMDVAYKVQPDGKLTASNNLVLNQLAFGDQVEGAPASLPVRLAVALLADRNGVIDLDLPVSGSLNDPQFSLGSVILKIIGNLIMKAVTAPFSLLTGAFSGADQQGAVDFAPGSVTLEDKARQQLDKIAKALRDRPGLKVTVVGWVDPQAELPAYKRERLHSQVLAQKRRMALRDGQQADAVTTVGAEEYAALLKEVYRRADIKKPRNLIGMAKDLPQTEMEALLMQNMQPSADVMANLALARSTAVRDYLVGHGVDAPRLFIGAGKLHESDGAAAADPWTPRVEMALSMQ